jgi:hypothetical protein
MLLDFLIQPGESILASLAVLSFLGEALIGLKLQDGRRGFPTVNAIGLSAREGSLEKPSVAEILEGLLHKTDSTIFRLPDQQGGSVHGRSL